MDLLFVPLEPVPPHLSFISLWRSGCRQDGVIIEVHPYLCSKGTRVLCVERNPQGHVTAQHSMLTLLNHLPPARVPLKEGKVDISRN